VKGITYDFNIFNPGHPWHISTDSVGGNTIHLVSSGQTGAPNDNGLVTFTPNNSHPPLLYYTCAFHPLMGYRIHVIDGYCVEDMNNLGPGVYTVKVMDANSQIFTASYTIADPPLLTADASANSPVCTGGTLQLMGTPTDGTPGYSYHWTGPAGFSSTVQNPVLNNFSAGLAGTYTFTVTDANGCVATNHVTVSSAPQLFVSCDVASEVSCHGASDGSVQVTASGGTPPYTGDGLYTGLQSRTITYTVSDDLGCIAVCSTTLNDPPLTAVTGFTPSSGCPGDVITITGANLNSTVDVLFNGQSADGFIIVDDTSVQAQVPAGASSGAITISSFCEDAVSVNPFTVTPCIAVDDTLLVKFYIQGYYIGGNTMPSTLFDAGFSANNTDCDSVTVLLYSALDVSLPAYSFSGIVQTNGLLTCIFPDAATGNDYYIAVLHRNAMETWSAVPVTMAA